MSKLLREDMERVVLQELKNVKLSPDLKTELVDTMLDLIFDWKAKGIPRAEMERRMWVIYRGEHEPWMDE